MSLEGLTPFLAETEQRKNAANPPVLILVGTQRDEDAKQAAITSGKIAVSQKDIDAFLAKNQMPYYAVSAKTKDGISELVTALENNARKRAAPAATNLMPSIQLYNLPLQQSSGSKSLLSTALTATAIAGVGVAIFKYKASLALLMAAHSPALLVGLIVLAAITAIAAKTAYQSYANNRSAMYQPVQQTGRPTTCTEKLTACLSSFS